MMKSSIKFQAPSPPWFGATFFPVARNGTKVNSDPSAPPEQNAHSSDS